MNKILLPALLALALSACGTTGGTKATVEDHSGGAAATTGQAGAETTGVGAGGVAGNAMSDPRTDPASPLAKRSVYFDFDSYVVKNEYRPMLEAHAGFLKSKPELHVTLQGNTDERGSREYNLALGQKRAEAVRKTMSVLGVSDGQMEAVSFGEEKPRNDGHTEAAYAENRRTDIVYSDEK